MSDKIKGRSKRLAGKQCIDFASSIEKLYQQQSLHQAAANV
jgi:hypothetical protein